MARTCLARRETGSAALEYVGVLVVVALLIGIVVSAFASVAPEVSQQVACAVRSVTTQEGSCGGDDSPTEYGAGDDSDREEVDPTRVSDALDQIRDDLDGGWNGVRSGELDSIFDTLGGLNGREIDAVVAELSDDDLRHLVDEMDDGWLGSGWDRERRRQFWNLLAERASRETLERLADFTSELQPGFENVGGDDARDDPGSTANTAEYGDLDFDLFDVDGDEPAVHPEDVRQGAIGDCWFIASMMAVAQTHPELLERNIRENPNGSFTVTLYDDGSPVEVTVTPDMVLKPDGTPAFVDDPRRGSEAELWPLVLEKAMALHAGDFADLEGDSPARALDALTGQETSSMGGDDLPSIGDLDRLLDGGGAIALSSLSDGDDHPRYDRDPADGGLVTGHAYYVSDIDAEAGTVTVVNPWGIDDYPPITMSFEDFTRDFREFHLNEVTP